MGLEKYREQQLIEQRDRRRSIADKMLRGLNSRSEIAIAHGISPVTAGKDMRAIREQWLLDDPVDVKAKVTTRVRQIEAAAFKALAAFDRSQKNKEEVTCVTKDCDNSDCNCGIVRETKVEDGVKTVRNIECPFCHGTEKITIETRKITGQAGDCTFLKTAISAFVECARIEGLITSPGSSLSALRGQTETLPNGTVRETFEALTFDGTYDQIIAAKAVLDQMRIKSAITEGLILPQAESQDEE